MTLFMTLWEIRTVNFNVHRSCLALVPMCVVVGKLDERISICLVPILSITDEQVILFVIAFVVLVLTAILCVPCIF